MTLLSGQFCIIGVLVNMYADVCNSFSLFIYCIELVSFGQHNNDQISNAFWTSA